VEKIILDNPVYDNNHLLVVDISFMYTQEVCGLLDDIISIQHGKLAIIIAFEYCQDVYRYLAKCIIIIVS
jgi:hypothetical protein